MIEQWTLKALEQQQEFVTKAVEQLQATDKQWKAELEDLQQKTVENLRKTAGNAVADSYEEWTNRTHEALNKLQELSLNQSKSSYSLVKQAQEQYHQVVTQLVEEQKKTRQEFQHVSDAYVEQVKSLQKSFAQSLEQYAVVK
jgi:polyhydroxyalkanoic acid inclusion protein PhaP